MPSGPQHSLSEPPSARHDLWGEATGHEVGNGLGLVLALRNKQFSTFIHQRNAPIQRLHLGGVFCCAQL